MGSGIDVEHGNFIGTGVAHTVVLRLGFRPRRIELHNVSADPAAGLWTDGMEDDSVFKQKTGTTTLATSNGVTPTDDGFTVGTDTDLNVAGEQVSFIAYK